MCLLRGTDWIFDYNSGQSSTIQLTDYSVTTLQGTFGNLRGSTVTLVHGGSVGTWGPRGPAVSARYTAKIAAQT